MPRIEVLTKTYLEIESADDDALEVIGREMIADLSGGTLGHNQNVLEIEIVGLDSTETIIRKKSLMPIEISGVVPEIQ